MEKPLISVIIPTYKVEKYIKECLDSIINQSYKNLEIIIVDDKSPDDTVAILRKYEKRDSRIKVFVLDENSGSASAGRNKGLEIATGEYCTFVDSDDCFLDNDAIEKLYQAILETDTDLVVGYPGIYNKRTEKWEFNGYYQKHPCENFLEQSIFSQNEIIKFPGQVTVVPWAKLYNLSLIKKHRIQFPSRILGEDVVFSARYLLIAQRGLVALREPLYIYHKENGVNISTQRSKNFQINIVSRLVFEAFEEKNSLDYSWAELNWIATHRFLSLITHPYGSFSASYLYFYYAKKELFNRFLLTTPSSFKVKDKRGINLTRRSALLGYFYFGFINDPKLMGYISTWKKTYLVQIISEPLKLIKFTILSLLKIAKNTVALGLGR